jgi:hypothetical protein
MVTTVFATAISLPPAQQKTFPPLLDYKGKEKGGKQNLIFVRVPGDARGSPPITNLRISRNLAPKMLLPPLRLVLARADAVALTFRSAGWDSKKMPVGRRALQNGSPSTVSFRQGCVDL